MLERNKLEWDHIERNAAGTITQVASALRLEFMREGADPVVGESVDTASPPQTVSVTHPGRLAAGDVVQVYDRDEKVLRASEFTIGNVFLDSGQWKLTFSSIAAPQGVLALDAADRFVLKPGSAGGRVERYARDTGGAAIVGGGEADVGGAARGRVVGYFEEDDIDVWLKDAAGAVLECVPDLRLGLPPHAVDAYAHGGFTIAAINRAIDIATAAGVRRVALRAGTWDGAGPINITGDDIVLYGAGTATVVAPTSGAAFAVTAAERFAITDLLIQPTAGGIGISISPGSAEGRIARVRIDGGAIGIASSGASLDMHSVHCDAQSAVGISVAGDDCILDAIRVTDGAIGVQISGDRNQLKLRGSGNSGDDVAITAAGSDNRVEGIVAVGGLDDDGSNNDTSHLMEV